METTAGGVDHDVFGRRFEHVSGQVLGHVEDMSGSPAGGDPAGLQGA